MAREVDLRLNELIERQVPKPNAAQLAKRLGISEGTMHRYIENRWTVLDRTVIEGLADFFQCDAAALLTTVESSFFAPFETLYNGARTCFYVRRTDADQVHSVHSGRRRAYRDNRAIDRVSSWLSKCVKKIVDFEGPAVTPEQFDERLSQNCVVVGSPMVNPASEMAICRAFGADPFGPSVSTKIPFAFRVPAAPTPAESSVLEASPDGRLGIWLREEGVLLEVNSWPSEEFRKIPIQRGRDCGVVVVSNYQPAGEPGVSRKLMVLSGFGGVGTEAAASALVEHYRDLEPREGNACVWGLIEVLYKKDADSTEREILHYNWRYREGGRCPLAFAKKKAHA